MRDWYPCKLNRPDYSWRANVLLDENDNHIKTTAMPENSYCNSCDRFKQCIKEVLEWSSSQLNTMEKDMEENRIYN